MSTITLRNVVLAISLTGSLGLIAEEPPASDESFRAALQKHLAAVQGRDLKALEETITQGDTLTLIFSDGEKLGTRQQFLDFHKEWFGDKSWKWQPEILQVIETPTLAHVLLKYRYDSTDKDHKPRQSSSLLALTFAKEKAGWRLVFDQNTRIQTAKP